MFSVIDPSIAIAMIRHYLGLTVEDTKRYYFVSIGVSVIIVAILEVFQGVEWTASAVGNMDTTIFYYLTGLITVLFVVYPGWKFLNMNKSALFGIALDVAMKRETMEKSTEKADDIFDKSEAAQGFGVTFFSFVQFVLFLVISVIFEVVTRFALGNVGTVGFPYIALFIFPFAFVLCLMLSGGFLITGCMGLSNVWNSED